MVQHVRHTAHRRMEPHGSRSGKGAPPVAVVNQALAEILECREPARHTSRVALSGGQILAGAARCRRAAGALRGCGRARRRAGRSLWALAPCPSRVPHLAARPTAPVPISVLHGGLSLDISRRDDVSRRAERAVDGGRCLLRGSLHRFEAVEYSWRHTIDVPFFDTHWSFRLARYW